VTAILLGTSISGKPGATVAREREAQAALAQRTGEGDAVAVNLAFGDEAPAAGAVEQIRALTRDAPSVSGRPGPRKPLVSEMLDVLCDVAAERGLARAGIVNADIIVTPAAVDRIASLRAPAIAISRTDVGGAPEETLLYGADMFVVDTTFWRTHRPRFRPYILGEPIWDNVYAAISTCHGGVLLNRERLLLHERHPSETTNSPFAVYLHGLAARDRAYFTRWCTYVAHAEALRARGGTADEDEALQRAVFMPPSIVEHGYGLATAAWWRAKRMASA
jgi:hypothetical protein